jgi:uncharacterized protein HemX
MKSIILRLTLGVLMLFASGVVFGQDNNGSGSEQVAPPRKHLTPEEKADHQTKKLTERLNLTGDQQTKVRAIILISAKQEEKDRQDAVGDKAQMISLNRQRDEKKREEIKKVLTPDQIKIYDTPSPRQNPPPPPAK